MSINNSEDVNARLVERTEMLNREIFSLEERFKVATENADKAEKEAGDTMIRLEISLKEKEVAISELEARLEELKKLKTSQDSDISKQLEMIQELNGEIASRGNEIKDLQLAIEEKKHDVELHSAVIAAEDLRIKNDIDALNIRAKEISDGEDYISGKLSDIDARIAALDHRESNIAGAEKINADQKLNLDYREGSLRAKEINLNELTVKYQEDKAKLDMDSADLANKIENYGALLLQLNEDSKTLASNQEKFVADNANLAARERDYQAKLADITVREQIVKTKEKLLQITQ